MSMYSTLELQLKPKTILTNNDIENIKKDISHICGANDFVDISPSSIHFCVTYNYGLDKVKKLMDTLEQYIEYIEPVEVGRLSTEEIWRYVDASVFSYKNKLMIVITEDQGVFNIFCEEITIDDLRGNFIRKMNQDKNKLLFLEEMIKEFNT